MNIVLTNITVSVTELKRDFAGILKQADNSPVAVLLFFYLAGRNLMFKLRLNIKQ